jgi:hypothetical protein
VCSLRQCRKLHGESSKHSTNDDFGPLEGFNRNFCGHIFIALCSVGRLFLVQFHFMSPKQKKRSPPRKKGYLIPTKLPNRNFKFLFPRTEKKSFFFLSWLRAGSIKSKSFFVREAQAYSSSDLSLFFLLLYSEIVSKINIYKHQIMLHISFPLSHFFSGFLFSRLSQRGSKFIHE